MTSWNTSSQIFQNRSELDRVYGVLQCSSTFICQPAQNKNKTKQMFLFPRCRYKFKIRNVYLGRLWKSLFKLWSCLIWYSQFGCFFLSLSGLLLLKMFICFFFLPSPLPTSLSLGLGLFHASIKYACEPFVVQLVVFLCWFRNSFDFLLLLLLFYVKCVLVL